MDIRETDKEIDSLNIWIHEAAKALISFYDESQGVFYRDSFGAGDKNDRKHPTATNRAFFALSEYLRFLNGENLENGKMGQAVKRILKGVAENYLFLLPSDPNVVRTSSSNEVNMFTDSHLLLSVVVLESIKDAIALSSDLSPIKDVARTIVEENINKLERWKGGKVKDGDEVHDFVSLHAVRGIDAFYGLYYDRTPSYSQAFQDRVKHDVIHLLAYDYAGISSKFDAAELAFSIALLNHFSLADVQQLTEKALKSIADKQSADGAWPTARFISYEGRGLLHVASYEVALTLANLLLRDVYEGSLSYSELILPPLKRTFELVKSSFSQLNELSGWANDHTRREGLIESWTTSIVLTFLIHYRDGLHNMQQHKILKRYHAEEERVRKEVTWPDLLPTLRHMGGIAIDSFDISDPTDNEELTRQIKNNFLRPVKDTWTHRPSNTSLLMYGPPGTRKTTLARQMAKVLRWPFLVLSPPDFLRKGGLEGFEAAAAEIFDDLLRLRRVVLLFDECEDFFKKRPDNQQLESRTIGAFITSGMLPRLQALHDRRWTILLLATNSDPEHLDDAVTRPGRFDFQQLIGYPSDDAQKIYIEKKLHADPVLKAFIKDALERYSIYRQTLHGLSDLSVSFANIDALINHYRADRDGMEPGDARRIDKLKEATKSLERLVSQKGPPTLAPAT